VLCDTAAKIGNAVYWHERITAVRNHGIAPLAEAILTRWFSPDFIQQQPAAYRGYSHMLTRTELARELRADARGRPGDQHGAPGRRRR
jgi:3-oxoadipate enol-lactonase